MVHVVHHVLRLLLQEHGELFLPDRALLDDRAFQSVRVHVEEVNGRHRFLHVNVIRYYAVLRDIRVVRFRCGFQFLVPAAKEICTVTSENE